MTRPPPPAAATCNLFCLRARVAGAGGGGVGSGVGTAAPQVVLVQRGPIRGHEPHALCPRRRPAPSPPLPPALPRPGLRSRYPLCGCGSRRPATTHAGTAGRSGRRSGSLVRCGGSAAAQPRIPRCWDRRGRGPGTRGGSRLRPVARAGLKEARCRRCHHRSGQGPSVQPFLPSPPVRGCPQPGAPPARLPSRPGVGGRWRPASGS